MRILTVATLLVCSTSPLLAQNQSDEKLCYSAPPATTVSHDEGVTVQEIVLSGTWGSNEATAYLPDKEIADGAVVFSHSAIHSDSDASEDLMAFAATLAHAGAAVIVPQRTLLWPATDQWMNREGGVVICAEHWLIDHTKVFNDGKGTVQMVDGENVVLREGYGYVGPALCSPSVTSSCEHTGPFTFDDCGYTRYCRTSIVGVPIGEILGGDNTNDVLSKGGLREAQWLQRRLGLIPIGALATPHPAASGS
jgi:hypothetical protein